MRWYVDTPITDLFDLVVCGEAHASSPRQRPGGEWDPWYGLPARTRRRLIGAGFARPGAMEPDVLADMIRDRHPGLNGQDPLDWYFRTALLVLDERRKVARHRRTHALIRRSGHASYYAHRTSYCASQGYESVWHYRRAKGWA